jgi:RNA polymerase sigma factor (sigma-70 family)
MPPDTPQTAMRVPSIENVAQVADPQADQAPAGSHGEALSRLFEEHNHSLHSFLMMHLGSEHEAKEVAQEAYVRVLQLHQPGAVSFLRAYLFKTAANIAVDRARQRSARARIDRRDSDEERVDLLGPDRRVLAAQELALIEQALYELPPKYRRAFILHRFDDWTTAQIAQELGVRERMVRNYIQRTVIYCKLRVNGLSPSEAKARVTP